MEIVFKNKNLIVINKPQGIGAQADKIGDTDAMSLASAMLRELGESDSLWLVHRIDRVVGGLLVFARNKSTAAALSALVGGGMLKEYFAVVEGEFIGGEMRDFLYKDAKKSKAFVVKTARGGVKEAISYATPLASVKTPRGVYTLVKVKLETGRYHQIRAQLSSRSFPIVGDGKYGSRDNSAKFPALFSHRIAAEAKNLAFDVSVLPDLNEYPWCLFDADSYK